MSYLSSIFYDRFMASVEKSCLSEWREELLKEINGDVLEIGAGTGVNMKFYPESLGNDLRLVMSEPDRNMRIKLEEKIAEKIGKKIWGKDLRNISISGCYAENIDAMDESFDFAVSSLVFCSVKEPQAALSEIRRVLKPDGKLIFLEHVAADMESRTRKWQDRLTPLWSRIAGNCHMNRDTEKAIISAGFDIIAIKREKMPPIAGPVRFTIRGIAQKI